MVEVVWTIEALDDLETLGTFHERTSATYAASLIQRLFESVVALKMHPRLGRKVPEIDQDLVRELIIENYRVVYHLFRDRIEIVAVLHGRQDLMKKFREHGGDV